MKTYTRSALVAAFLGGIIIGHVTGPATAGAHGSSTSDGANHIADHLHQINDTLKKIERKIK